MPKIKTINVVRVFKNGEPAKDTKTTECLYEGQRFMYDGVFDDKLSMKHTLFDGWAILKGLCEIIFAP